MKKLWLLLLLIWVFSCSTEKKARKNAKKLQIISVSWSDNRHLAYIAECGDSYQFHIAQLVHNSPKIIFDSTITSDIDRPYSPIAYCHTLQEAYFPHENSILKYDIAEKALMDFAMYLPVKYPIEEMFAQPGSTMAYAAKSDYREDFEGDFFWWLIWMDLVNGEIIFDTHDCFSPFGFYLENDKGLLHYVAIDTIGPQNDTTAYTIDKKNRRLKKNMKTPKDIQKSYRNEWQSPNMKYIAVQGDYGIEIEQMY
ncbi:MAG: hypothetical protein ACLFSQ_05920 [Candidatus Zixiibacteriota bacterium]